MACETSFSMLFQSGPEAEENICPSEGDEQGVSPPINFARSEGILRPSLFLVVSPASPVTWVVRRLAPDSFTADSFDVAEANKFWSSFSLISAMS